MVSGLLSFFGNVQSSRMSIFGHPAIPRSELRAPTEPVLISRPLSGQLRAGRRWHVTCVPATGQGPPRQPRTKVVALIIALLRLCSRSPAPFASFGLEFRIWS